MDMEETTMSEQAGRMKTFHHHEAKYVDGVLVRECNHCGEDLMHESHLRSRQPLHPPPELSRKATEHPASGRAYRKEQ